MKSAFRRSLAMFPLAPEFRQVLVDLFFPITFGQLGEDAVIDNHLGWLGLDIQAPGIYLDIGAHHPTKGSNTFRFYRRGARGFAVDVGTRKKRLWEKLRSRDHYIDAAVVPNSWKEANVLFRASPGYGSGTDSVQGFGVVSESSEDIITSVTSLRAGELTSIVLSDSEWEIAPWRLLTIDIEGLDQQVLQDLRLCELKPDIIALESFPPVGVSCWNKIRWLSLESPMVQFLEKTNYSLQSICGPTLIFLRKESLKKRAT